MKKNKLFAALAVLLFVCSGMHAGKPILTKVYMFGFSASFNDTIVHFTDIQTLDSAWTDQKTHFLLEREVYSYQLRDYLDLKEQMPFRTCMVFYDQKREKLEKKFQKMRRLYTNTRDGRQHYDVRQLDDFRFRAVNLSDYDTEPEPVVADGTKVKEKHDEK